MYQEQRIMAIRLEVPFVFPLRFSESQLEKVLVEKVQRLGIDSK